MVVQAAPVTSSTLAVAVDVGKNEFAFSVTDSSRVLLLKPRTGCPMTGPSLAKTITDIQAVLPSSAAVKVGIEAAGDYHRPLLGAGSWPQEWELLELNPGHVTEQRKVLGKRTIKTDRRLDRSYSRLGLLRRAGSPRPRAPGWPGPNPCGAVP